MTNLKITFIVNSCWISLSRTDSLNWWVKPPASHQKKKRKCIAFRGTKLRTSCWQMQCRDISGTMRADTVFAGITLTSTSLRCTSSVSFWLTRSKRKSGSRSSRHAFQQLSNQTTFLACYCPTSSTIAWGSTSQTQSSFHRLVSSLTTSYHRRSTNRSIRF